MSETTSDADLKTRIRDHYAERALAASEPQPCGCSCNCGPAAPVAPQEEIAQGLYAIDETSALPPEAVLASLGCGNPTALADLQPGEVVLDLGSGCGIDVLLSARRVGPTGKAYGLDMTDEMLALARENQRKAGATNVEFLKGTIEAIPLPDASVDVIISNCVINLSTDKDAVLREAFRVLKPGGRFAVSDVIVRGTLPEPVRKSMALWTGCVAGALEEEEFLGMLREAGFENPSIEVTRAYTRADAEALLQGTGIDLEVAADVEGKIISGFVRATKPGTPPKRRAPLAALGAAKADGAAPCCAPGCCD